MDDDVRNLIQFLAEDCGWPLEEEQIKHSAWPVNNSELGLNDDVSVDSVEIYELRPLRANQPWGIFFLAVKGTSKLSITLLRKLLRGLVRKKRASANTSNLQQWNLEDLMFVCSLDEPENTTRYFAHFKEQEKGLPKLMIGARWQDSQPENEIKAAKLKLKSNLKWPDHEADVDLWRKNWRKAFTIGHKEVIRTSSDLSIALAKTALEIKRSIPELYEIERENGPIHILHNAICESLIKDLDLFQFADMIAQTITYGLFSTRATGTKLTGIETMSDCIPSTNPFLKDLFAQFSSFGGDQPTDLDFDDLSLNELISMLNELDVDSVMDEFGSQFKGGAEDPVIHFYESFLRAYDRKIKADRGVFYTPKSVVSYIVRSIDDKLRLEFGLADGLADTATWRDMIERFPNLKKPKDADLNQAFVQILDPATGTGTFLVEVIIHIHKTLTNKWKREKRTKREVENLWNQYVSEHLLPRISGYELMMAPYVIAHLKIGLILKQTGYDFQSDKRLQVYLTNSLDSASSMLNWIPDFLANEAKAVNLEKEKKRFTVIIGNPPYSGRSWNLAPNMRERVQRYKYIDGVKLSEKGALQLEKNIQEDYIKFVQLAEESIQKSGSGIVGYVISHGLLDNSTLRGVRYSLCSSFDELTVLDMHGNVSRGALSPSGEKDENVFDIKKTGACVITMRKGPELSGSNCSLFHCDLWGSRSYKYSWLNSHIATDEAYSVIDNSAPDYLFIRENRELRDEYNKGASFDKLFEIYSNGLVTGRDRFVTDMEKNKLLERISIFSDLNIPDEKITELYGLKSSSWWDLRKARESIANVQDHESYIREILYRLFDKRICYYHKPVFESLRRPVARNIDPGLENLLLITTKMTKGESFAHIFCSDIMNEAILLSPKTSNNANAFPLYKIVNGRRMPNIRENYLFAIQDHLNSDISVENNINNWITNLSGYIYGILHSNGYRVRYGEFLKRSFPHIPVTSNVKLFEQIAKLGLELIEIHLLNFSIENTKNIEVIRSDRIQVEKPSYSNETIWVDKECKFGFRGVSEEIWNFRIGGYRVCEKWLKSRQGSGGKNPKPGKILSKEDIAHYLMIIEAVDKTIRTMEGIDELIKDSGGWPLEGSKEFLPPVDREAGQMGLESF